jgi:hypothetical protein
VVDKQGYYSANKEIACRELKREFLIFSGASRQTLLVHPYAFKLIQHINIKSSTYNEILVALGKDVNELGSDNLAGFISASLEQFLDFGVLDYSED